ncbi:hypothetical protein QAD02_015187 [Eretmocerus hayati]|uniref:Uncharacterized protein n=1 Tax=Eretmocerus hayati TaxID=131215 RepID=A0ACC2P7L2_9HYME|nr:hypothetical protein QAD02_015187 [Eretmocerus hayati]
MKSTLLEKIENPDVPGLESEIPPPPPRPSISGSQRENICAPPNPSGRAQNSTAPVMEAHTPVNTYYSDSINSLIIPPPPPPEDQPWWIPNETDSEAYTQWYESAYKAALSANNEKEAGVKGKKILKRKPESIDAKTDAERVANAQKELCLLMKPLKCDLCNAVMNSTLQAKLHYQGKPHQKKVSMYLNQSAKTPKAEDGQVSSSTSDWNSHCEVCKIWFTSETDASQHYAGKKHLKAAFGQVKPKASKASHSNKLPEDPSGLFGIGLAFHPEVAAPAPPVPIQNPTVAIPPVPQYSQPPITYQVPLRCDLCGISTNRQDQLETHLRGSKHLKMLRSMGISAPIVPEKPPAPTGTTDYSIHRTPSGHYYCAPCNLSVNSEAAFIQHIDSKKHKSKVNPNAEAPSPAKKSRKK